MVNISRLECSGGYGFVCVCLRSPAQGSRSRTSRTSPLSNASRTQYDTPEHRPLINLVCAKQAGTQEEVPLTFHDKRDFQQKEEASGFYVYLPEKKNMHVYVD